MSSLAVSQIEKHFITNEIYKRSKRYFDVIKLKSIESNDSKFRRAPSNIQRQQLEKKIENSFMSSQEYFTNKRISEIQKHKNKQCLFDHLDDTDQTETNYSVATKNHPLIIKKGFDMSKSLPRQFYENLQNHTFTSIQDPFDNFISSDFSKGQKGKSIDFNKILGRKDISCIPITSLKNKKLDNGSNPENQTSLNSKYLPSDKNKDKTKDINKAYQKFYFDGSKFKCLIDLEKQRKAEDRRSLRTSSKWYQEKQISLDRIEKGRAFSHKNPTPSCLMFYHGKGMEETSPMHIRLLKKNEKYWNQRIKAMKKEDFESVKRREQMIDKRLTQINLKRKVVDERGQICDSKYFLRNKHT